jgi:hypothetical protein
MPVASAAPISRAAAAAGNRTIPIIETPRIPTRENRTRSGRFENGFILPSNNP